MERPGQQAESGLLARRLLLAPLTGFRQFLVPVLVLVCLLSTGPASHAQQESPRESALDVPVRVPGPPRESDAVTPRREPTQEPRHRVALLFLAGPELASQVPAPAGTTSERAELPLIELAVREVRPYVTSLSSRTDLALFLVSSEVDAFRPAPEEPPGGATSADPAPGAVWEEGATEGQEADPDQPYHPLTDQMQRQVVARLEALAHDGPPGEQVSGQAVEEVLRRALTTDGVEQIFLVAAELGGLRIRPIGARAPVAGSIEALLRALPTHRRPRVNVISLAPLRSLADRQLRRLASCSGGVYLHLP